MLVQAEDVSEFRGLGEGVKLELGWSTKVVGILSRLVGGYKLFN